MCSKKNKLKCQDFVPVPASNDKSSRHTEWWTMKSAVAHLLVSLYLCNKTKRKPDRFFPTRLPKEARGSPYFIPCLGRKKRKDLLLKPKLYNFFSGVREEANTKVGIKKKYTSQHKMAGKTCAEGETGIDSGSKRDV